MSALPFSWLHERAVKNFLRRHPEMAPKRKRTPKLKSFTGVIYKYTNRVNGKVYIGQTTRENKRYREHFTHKDDSLFHRAVKKYGWGNFDYEVLHKQHYLTLEDLKFNLNWLEVYYIAKFNAYTNGYNLNIGGGTNRGYVFSEEARRHFSEIHKNRHHTEESKRKLSERKKGVPQPHFYKAVSQYTKDGKFVRDWNSIQEAAETLGINDCVLSCCVKGRVNSAGGFKWTFKGVKVTEEWKSQPVGQQFRRVLQIDRYTNKIIRIYEGITEAVNQTGFSRSSLNNCLSGGQRQHRGYKWAWEGTELSEEWIANTDEFTRGRILQIDPETGEVVKVWIRMQAAADAIGGCQANISSVCLGKRRTAYGYIWKFEDTERNIDFVPKPKRLRAVCQYDLYGNLIKEWDSIKEAAEAMGCARGAIAQCCSGGAHRTSHGFKWRFKDTETKQ